MVNPFRSINVMLVIAAVFLHDEYDVYQFAGLYAVVELFHGEVYEPKFLYTEVLV